MSIHKWKYLLLLLAISSIAAEDPKEDDPQEDWVPIDPPKQRASARVLNLARDSYQPQRYQQNLRYPVTGQEFQPSNQQFEAHFHQGDVPLLPQSLQRFIYQGEPFVPPPPQRQNVSQIRYREQLPPNENAEVQLLYVPVDALKNRQPFQPPPQHRRPNPPQNRPPSVQIQQPGVQLQQPTVEYQQQNIPYQPQSAPAPIPTYQQLPHQSQPVHKTAQLQNIEQDFVRQAVQAHRFQEQLEQLNAQAPIPKPLPPRPHTTLPPKKRKPHQPPLAMYMRSEGHDVVRVNDVLKVLKHAPTISVQDTVGSDSPMVFVGPSNLNAPRGYAKFELPYLSSIEGNRVERKVENLPFFVAPLSYKAPAGYAKIPFPAPHVGSIVVNQIVEAEKTQQTTPRPVHTTTSYQEIPYGPLPTVPDRKVTSNPYGPTPVHTTQQYYNPIQEAYKNTQARSTTPAPQATNDKYTVLEQFPIRHQTDHTTVDDYHTRNTYQKDRVVYTPSTEYTRSKVYVTSEKPVKYYTTSDKSFARPDNHLGGREPVYSQPEESADFIPSYVQQISISTARPTTQQVPVQNVKVYTPQPDYQEDHTTQKSQYYEPNAYEQSTHHNVQVTTREPPHHTSPHHRGVVAPNEYSDGETSYRLPSNLPPINPHLPGLINSLQEQSLRPLLAPLLLPPFDELEEVPQVSQEVLQEVPQGSQEVPHVPQGSQEVPHVPQISQEVPQVSHEVPQVYQEVLQEVVTTTPAPTVQTTTRPRTRGRYRATRPTTETPYRSTQHRRRRPTNIRTRPEVTTTTTETPRVRYETEAPQRAAVNRQRFRTRGRPTVPAEQVVEVTPAPQPKLTYQGGYAEDYASAEYQREQQSGESREEYSKEVSTEPAQTYDFSKEYPKQVSPTSTPGYKSEANIPEQIRNRYSYRTETSTGAQRSRTRPRARTQPQTSEAPQAQQESGEFYGFFREPNFEQPEDQYSQAPTSLPYVASSYLPLASQDDAQDVPVTHRATLRVTQPVEVTSTEKYYTVRPSRRPEEQTQRVTRVRGRIRKPTRPTTESYHEPTHSIAQSRGKAHYSGPDVERKHNHKDISEENYPESFLKAHATEKPSFRLTIVPDDESDELYSHESVRSEQVAESQVAAKVVARPQNYNALDSDEKQTEKVVTTSVTTSITTSVTEPTTTTEPPEPETTTEYEFTTLSGKRRGVWKLVKRPLDVFEPAESQNVEFVPNNIVGDVKTTTFQTAPTTETTNTDPTYPTEGTNHDILEPLFAMFGFDSPPTTEIIPDATTIFEPEAETTTHPQEEFARHMNYSTSTEISQETEICYRGRCIKSKQTKKPMDVA